jgi:hypothetical protein
MKHTTHPMETNHSVCAGHHVITILSGHRLTEVIKIYCCELSWKALGSRVEDLE